MEFNVKLKLWFDGIDDCTPEAVENVLLTCLRDGADVNCCEIYVRTIEEELK